MIINLEESLDSMGFKPSNHRLKTVRVKPNYCPVIEHQLPHSYEDSPIKHK